VVTALNKR